MSFQVGRRRGNVWDDVLALDLIIKEARFNKTGADERDFEMMFGERLDTLRGSLKGELISQRSKEAPVQSVYCFGKKHRPDLTINTDGIAIELKFLNSSLDGIKEAIGQSNFYRIRYRFVINLFIVGEKHKNVYLAAANGEEQHLEEILRDLSTDSNIFSYIVPAFSPGSNVKACLEWNDIRSESD